MGLPLISGIGQLVISAISQFHLSPEEKIQAQQAQALLVAHEEEFNTQIAAQLAGTQAELIKTQTGPNAFLLYTVIVAIGMDLIVFPLLHMLGAAIASLHGGLPFTQAISTLRIIEIPPGILTLFGTMILGYVGQGTAASVLSNMTNVAQMPGESHTEAKAPFGLGSLVLKNISGK